MIFTRHAQNKLTAAEIVKGGTILRVVVGSTCHGTALPGKADRDEKSIVVEPRETVIGLQSFETYRWRDAPGDSISQPGDIDFEAHSVRKWIKLVLAGNPSELLPLFVSDEHVLECDHFGNLLRALAPAIASRHAAPRFAGYLNHQVLDCQKPVSVDRPDRMALFRRYGYDCYLDDTEFLTRQGWKRYDEISDAEELGTVQAQTGTFAWQLPTERVAKPYSGEIYFFENAITACAVTPNHRMLVSPVARHSRPGSTTTYHDDSVWRFKSAEQLLADSCGWFHTRTTAVGHDVDADISDAEIILTGCYISEGSIAKRRKDGTASVLTLSQKAGGRMVPYMDRVAQAMSVRKYSYERTYAPPRQAIEAITWTVANRSLAQSMAIGCGTGSANKMLPSWAFDLSTRQADLLLDAMISGDGTEKPTARVYYTQSARLAGDVQALATINGHEARALGPYAYGDGTPMYQVYIKDQKSGPQVLIARDNGIRHLHRGQVEGGRVVCFTVPNETLVTRRLGKVSLHGNTKSAYHAVRLGLQGVEYLETGRMTLPMKITDRNLLVDIRLGCYTLAQVVEMTFELKDKIEHLATSSPLPEKPDYYVVERTMIQIHEEFWSLEASGLSLA